MSHVRTQIRDAVAGLLTSVSPVIGPALKSRTWPIAETSLPVTLVYTNAEGIDVGEGDGFDVYDRVLQVVIEPVVQNPDDVDTVLDDQIAAVETALGNDIGLGGLVLHCLLRAIEIIISTEGAQPIARARLTYEARYRTSFTDPTIVI